VKLLIRLCKDLGEISFVEYVNIQPLIENISKQLTGWQKSSKYQIFMASQYKKEDFIYNWKSQRDKGTKGQRDYDTIILQKNGK